MLESSNASYQLLNRRIELLFERVLHDCSAATRIRRVLRAYVTEKRRRKQERCEALRDRMARLGLDLKAESRRSSAKKAR